MIFGLEFRERQHLHSDLTSSRANVHDGRIYSLIGPAFTISANEGQGIFCWNKKLIDGSQIYYNYLPS